ncbi:DUF6153 family protein [Streptomyces sp. NPDC005423]|uniref:DUF6153 family protein n=1 Tax=Streptomyces sp. NPDC005423 TaxID=3155343 RepID=UPI0033B741DF
MILPGQPAAPRRPLWRSGLLVAAVLLGLLGMHGLGPVPGADMGPGHGRVTSTAVVSSAEKASDGGSCGCEGGMTHADPLCVSASVAGTPVVVPVLCPDVAAAPDPSGPRAARAGAVPEGGRAPPSLSELQLLRI